MKRFVHNDKELEMNQAERISRLFDQLHDGADSISIKATERIGGLKERSDAQMVKAALNKVGGNSSASVSVRFTMEFAQNNEDAITDIVHSIHRYNDKVLSDIINSVPELREQGKMIAIQNTARSLLRDWGDRNGSYTDDQIDLAMEMSGVLTIPSGGYLEASLSMGTMVSELPNYRGSEKHYKAKDILTSDGRSHSVYVKVSESYGRKKVPFSVSYVQEFADKIVTFATIFEDMMSNSDGTDMKNLECLKAMCKRLDSLVGDHRIEEFGMNPEDTAAAKDMRDAVIKYLEA